MSAQGGDPEGRKEVLGQRVEDSANAQEIRADFVETEADDSGFRVHSVYKEITGVETGEPGEELNPEEILKHFGLSPRFYRNMSKVRETSSTTTEGMKDSKMREQVENLVSDVIEEIRIPNHGGEEREISVQSDIYTTSRSPRVIEWSIGREDGIVDLQMTYERQPLGSNTYRDRLEVWFEPDIFAMDSTEDNNRNPFTGQVEFYEVVEEVNRVDELIREYTDTVSESYPINYADTEGNTLVGEFNREEKNISGNWVDVEQD